MTSPAFHEVWARALLDVLHRGHHVSPRGLPVLEREASQLRFDGNRALLVHPVRGLNYRFAVAEWVWMLAGCDAVAPLARYNSQMLKFSDDGERLAGAYGPRFMPQFAWVADALRRDRDTRQAVMTIWKPTPAPSKDIPCTVAAQFLVRGGSLLGVWTMRSNDLWLGTPYDAYTFSRVSATVAGVVGVPLGDVVIQAGSSHLYEQHWDLARQVAERAAEGRSPTLPAHPGLPPRALLDAVVLMRPELAVDAVLPAPWDEYARAIAAGRSTVALDALEGGAA